MAETVVTMIRAVSKPLGPRPLARAIIHSAAYNTSPKAEILWKAKHWGWLGFPIWSRHNPVATITASSRA
ncbi:MAG: hypothetical protein GX168_09330 [Bacteroidales bacterium]|nr:hypothetical protein [Bacteroidales bacterium]